jgi:hydroxyacylglutathione hydrolase
MDTTRYHIIALTVGQMAANCYLVHDTKTQEVIIIDPGEDAAYIADRVTAIGATPKLLVATHGHFDHILGASELQLLFGVPFAIHEDDRFLVARMHETARHFLGRDVIEMPPVITQTFVDGDTVSCGDLSLRILHTPGHTPGSVCLYGQSLDVLFSGDTIFADGAVGRTDFSYASSEKLSVSLQRIFQLSLVTRILPGHGAETSVQKEKEYHTIHT